MYEHAATERWLVAGETLFTTVGAPQGLLVEADPSIRWFHDGKALWVSYGAPEGLLLPVQEG